MSASSSSPNGRPSSTSSCGGCVTPTAAATAAAATATTTATTTTATSARAATTAQPRLTTVAAKSKKTWPGSRTYRDACCWKLPGGSRGSRQRSFKRPGLFLSVLALISIGLPVCLNQPPNAANVAFVGSPQPTQWAFPRVASASGRPNLPPTLNQRPASSSQEPQQSWWPTAEERKKVGPLALLFFCILFNYTILRDTKDVLVVTAPRSGAETIPFLKTYVQLPASISFAVLYSKLCDAMSQERIFYSLVTFFLVFFTTFAFLIYPNVGVLHPHGLADSLAATLPTSFAGPIAIFRNWSFALFYMMAELWGSVVVSVLFWGLSNRIMTLPEAKRYYPLFGLGANVALILSGQYVRFVSVLRSKLPLGVDKWGFSLKLLMSAVAASGVVILLTHRHIETRVLSDPAIQARINARSSSPARSRKSKPSMSLGQSIRYLASSKYIRNLAMIVIGYGMSINIIEVTWKARLKAQFADPNAYSMFMGTFSSVTGLLTLVMMLASRLIFARFGWGFAAKVTPLTVLISGGIFFSQVLAPQAWAPVAVLLGTTPLMLSVLVGAAQNILSKSAKYSLFDPCKEMAYIPLDAEQKSKGKAAIDVICNPLGKSGGSFLQQALIISLGSLSAAAPFLGLVALLVVTGWLSAAASLDKEMQALEGRDLEEGEENMEGERSTDDTTEKDS